MSIGALNGAIIAGNAPELRLEKLKSFWKAIEVEALPAVLLDPLGIGRAGSFRRMRNWSNAFATALFGSPRLFVPHILSPGRGHSRSLYENGVAAETLASFIDFDRLNGGDVRFALAATDVDAGEAVYFDTAKGDRIGAEHLLASSSFIPAFEPIRVGDRLLADGGLACNLPLECEVGPERNGQADRLCFALDLFTAGGGQPRPLNRVVESSIDLMFGMQSRMRLDALVREWDLNARLAEAVGPPAVSPRGVDLFYMSYRGPEEDAGFGKLLDLSPATLSDRIAEGRTAAQRALALLQTLSDAADDRLRVHHVRA